MQVFHDVFLKEKPLTTQKYFLCEVAIVEAPLLQTEVKLIFNFNFTYVRIVGKF